MEKMSSNKNLASLIFTKCTIKWVMSLWNLRNFSKSCFEYEIESCLQVNIITKITVKTPFIFHVRKVESQKNSINSVRSFLTRFDMYNLLLLLLLLLFCVRCCPTIDLLLYDYVAFLTCIHCTMPKSKAREFPLRLALQH